MECGVPPTVARSATDVPRGTVRLTSVTSDGVGGVHFRANRSRPA
jgi:hypothetical protein